MDTLTLAIGLIAIGTILMAAELLLPTHGILLGLGGAGLVIGVILSFRLGMSTGVTTLTIVAVLLPVAGVAALNLWPKTPMGRRLMLPEPDDIEAASLAPAATEHLRGRFGKAVSALRPCGTVNFDGQRVDCIAEGAMIEPGSWVRCVDIREGRVLVRGVDSPPDLGEFDPDLLR